MAGLVPAISLREAQCSPKRDARHKAGHDEVRERMPARIIDGKAVAAELRARVAAQVQRLRAAHGLVPGLAVVLVGENPAGTVYVRNKAKQTEEAGMRSFDHRLPETVSENELLALVAKLNAD